MRDSMRAAICGLFGVVLAWVFCGTGLAQNVPARPEVVPSLPWAHWPPPNAAARQYRPQPTYGPLQAGVDAYRMAEAERQRAVQRQVQLVQSAWSYHPWSAPYYVPSVPHLYAFPPRRALRRAYRFGYWPVPQPWPNVSIGVYRYPYSPWVRQPTGYERVRIGPNSYVYRPYYGQPSGQQNPPGAVGPTAPTPAAAPSEQPSGQSAHGRPALNSPIRPLPEAIPAPPAEPGPR